MKYLLELGFNQELSLAELKSIFPLYYIDVNDSFAFLESDQDLDQSFLNKIGGAKNIILIDQEIEQRNIESSINRLLDEHTSNYTSGKFFYAINKYNIKLNQKQLITNAKKYLKSKEISSAYCNKDFENTSSAQTLNLKIIEKGIEINIVNYKNKIYIGHTIAIQNINEYTRRDIKKPVRDMHVGMMSPKLSKIIINLATANQQSTIYDPFCGLGTILIEAIHNNHGVIGSDIESRMIEASKKNLEWFKKGEYELFQSDAKNINRNINFDHIVSEGYLGPNISSRNLDRNEILSAINKIEDIYYNFFRTIKSKLNNKSNIVICFPAFRYNNKYIYSSEQILEKITSIGYEVVNLLYDKKSILYQRKDQKVCREIFKFRLKD